MQVDVSTDQGVHELMAAVARELGGLDILVNNAGGVTAPHYPDAPAEHWGHTLDLNLRTVMLATQLAIGMMTARGGGAVVNIG